VGPVTGGVPAGAPFFVIGGYLMPKPFMTYDQQTQKLTSKNMIIQNEAATKEALHRVGYFSLISGYKDLFKNPTTRNYRDGTTFEDILALYHFDENLQELTLRHILCVEHHIRSVLSYAFCDAFGDSQTKYLTAQNYDYRSAKNQMDIARLINKHLNPLISRRTDYPYIEHHKTAHNNVPLWVLVNALSFGTISKMYTLSKPQLQSLVSQEFEVINEKQLGQILQVLTVYRNVCAHGERLFSYQSARNDIPDLPLHRKLAIPQKGAQYIYGKHDYFAVVLSLRYLLPNSDFLTYKTHLSQLIDKVTRNNQQITETQLLHIMGMPQNWKRITAYKKG
jgi:abortive infection bacteriophage resistance protein